MEINLQANFFKFGNFLGKKYINFIPELKEGRKNLSTAKPSNCSIICRVNMLVSITEELLGKNSSGSGQENREYDRGDPLR
jgi:hypothetical protein